MLTGCLKGLQIGSREPGKTHIQLSQGRLGERADHIRQFTLQTALLEGIRHLHAKIRQQGAVDRIHMGKLAGRCHLVVCQYGRDRTLRSKALILELFRTLANIEGQRGIDALGRNRADAKIGDAVGALRGREIGQQAYGNDPKHHTEDAPASTGLRLRLGLAPGAAPACPKRGPPSPDLQGIHSEGSAVIVGRWEEV